MTGDDAMFARLIAFGLDDHCGVCFHPGCGTDLTAKQADGRWGCPWHWDSPVQMELGL